MVTVGHILTMNIFECVAGKTLLSSSNRKSCMYFRTAHLNLTLVHSKVQGQGHAHFDGEYLGNGDR